MKLGKSRIGLKGKFLIVYFLAISLLMCLIGTTYYNSTSSTLYGLVTADLVSLLQKNNQIIDQRLEIVSEYANGLMVDEDIDDCLTQYQKAEGDYEVFAIDRPISQLLNKYFLYSEDVFSVNIMTSRMSYGAIRTSNIIPAETFPQSRVYRAALLGNGETVWVPTYHFFEEYHQSYIQSENASYQKVFSAAKLIKNFDGDYAILVINFLDSVYSDVFNTQDMKAKGPYFIIAPDGKVVSHSNRSYLGATLDYGWLDDAFQKKSGYESIQINGEEFIMCYDVSNVTGWMAGVIVQRSTLMEEFIQNILGNLAFILIILMIIPLFVVMLISSSFLQPLDALQKGIRASGAGDFDNPVPETGFSEVRGLIHRFNKMNSRIRQLIRENYEMVILKKEAELNAYNLQLNPHFILNSLNILNLELIRKGEDELSEVVIELSQMMDYTLNTKESLVPFSLDWNHTENYLKIMQKRYKDQFRYTAEIDPGILNTEVPKFFLQPFVENSIVHGFTSLPYPGQIKISAKLTGSLRVFVIEDNGSGIDSGVLQIIGSSPEGSIGINNIRYRLRCIYGDDFQLEISSQPYTSTAVTIRIPQ